jgi:hypothetical protein
MIMGSNSQMRVWWREREWKKKFKIV